MADAKPALVEIAKPEVGSGLHFTALHVRITAEGIRHTKPVWERYARKSANLLKNIPPRLLEAHCKVNEEISRRIRARRLAMSNLSL